MDMGRFDAMTELNFTRGWKETWRDGPLRNTEQWTYSLVALQAIQGQHLFYLKRNAG